MRYLAIAVCAGLLAAPAHASAQTGWFELAVPGSVENIPGAGASPTVAPRLLRELVGVFHDRAAVATRKLGPFWSAWPTCIGSARAGVRWNVRRVA